MDDLPDIINQSVLRATGQDEESNSHLSKENDSTFVYKGDSEKEVRYVFVNVDSFLPSFNIPPTKNGLIIYEKENGNSKKEEYVVELLRFGLVPKWALPKDPTPTAHGPEYSKEVNTFSSKFFNCRKETFAQHSPVWMGAKNNRCVVPIQGYYEWKKEGNNKSPYFVHSKSSPYIYLAGLYSHNSNFKNTEMTTNEGYLSSFTIITGPATNDDVSDMAWLHPRKPLMLLPGTQEWKEWLDPSKPWDDSMFETCLETKKNNAYLDIDIYPVSKDIGRTSSQGEYLMKKEEPEVKKQKDISLFFLSPKNKTGPCASDFSEVNKVGPKIKKQKDISLFFLPSKGKKRAEDSEPTELGHNHLSKKIKTENE